MFRRNVLSTGQVKDLQDINTLQWTHQQSITCHSIYSGSLRLVYLRVKYSMDWNIIWINTAFIGMPLNFEIRIQCLKKIDLHLMLFYSSIAVVLKIKFFFWKWVCVQCTIDVFYYRVSFTVLFHSFIGFTVPRQSYVGLPISMNVT